jgi:crotonobetainyl-CoA:carnitine CoA-transferase CaiB-like acyl-CoA transferase
MPPLCADESALFYALNRNKRSIALSLKSEAGASALRRLVKHYDVLLESFRPGVMAKWGLDADTLRKENPRLIYCAITGYGQTGPDRHKAGHDLNYLARSGLLGHGGSQTHGPAMPGGQFADIGGSVFALVGILSALYERQRTGEGRLVDISMTEGALAFLHMELGARLAMGGEGKALVRGADTLNGGLPGYSVYETQDGRYLAVASLEPKFMQGLCDALGHPEWADDAFDTGALGAELRKKLEETFRSHPLAYWVQHFHSKDVCVEPVAEGDDVLHDTLFRERGVFEERFDARRGEPVTQLCTPLRFGPMPFRPPPALGQDGHEILAEAGFSEEERQRLLS